MIEIKFLIALVAAYSFIQIVYLSKIARDTKRIADLLEQKEKTKQAIERGTPFSTFH